MMKQAYNKPDLEQFSHLFSVLTSELSISGDIDLDAGDGPLADDE